MGLLRADRRDNALAHAGDDRLLSGAADETGDVRAHGHARLGQDLNAVLRDGCDLGLALGRVGAVDDLGRNAGAHGFEQVTTREVDSRCRAEVEVQAGAVRRDQRVDNPHHLATGEVVRFEVARLDAFEARLHEHDLRVHHHGRIHLPQAHREHVEEPDAGLRQNRPQVQVGVLEEDEDEDEQEDPEDHHADSLHQIHEPGGLVLDEQHQVRSSAMSNHSVSSELARVSVGATTTRLP